MRVIVAKAAVVVAATSGLVARLLVPLSLERQRLRKRSDARSHPGDDGFGSSPPPAGPSPAPGPWSTPSPGRSAATRAGFPSSHPGAGRPSLARRDP